MEAFIFGAGGFAKEVEWLISECHIDPKPIVKAFVTNTKDPNLGKSINDIPIISEEEYLLDWNKKKLHQAYIAVGAPQLKKKIFEVISNGQVSFPNLIHPSVLFDSRDNVVSFGHGVIIFPTASLTTCISISNFVHINPGATIGHDSSIGQYSTISPGASISGNVFLGEQVFLGTKSCTIERINVASKIIIGAGAVVLDSLTVQGTYVGVPAKRVEK